MPKIQTDIPATLKPYAFHGVDFNYSEGEKEATAECPFCGRAGKFSVKVEDGLCRCVACNMGTEKGGGNPTVFIRLLYESIKIGHTTGDDLDSLAEDRGVDPSTLSAWGVVKSPFTGDWVIPGYGPGGELRQLYRYIRGSDRTRLNPTPGLGHQLFGMTGYDKKSAKVYLCEGPWDGMRLWELLGNTKMTDNGMGGHKLVPTSTLKHSLLADASVLATPSSSVFNEKWPDLFSGKVTYLLFDNDHEREHPTTNKRIPPAGFDGMKRVAKILLESPKIPKEVFYLDWGPGGFDPELKSGWDIRDHLGKETTAEELDALSDLFLRMEPIPDEWVESVKKGKAGGDDLELLDCKKYKDLINAWRKAMKWTDGLDRALSVMLASIASVRLVGDQLWVKVMGPASCGKSTLCEAVSVNKKYVYAKSTMRGFHSGYGEEGEDHSLISKVSGMTLVTKDGDTLLQSPNFKQILSEARDVYDTTSRTSYRNKKSKDYEGIRMTWILCGTGSLRALDQSELGERFLDCVIMQGIDDDLEDEILWRVANRTSRNMKIESNGKAETMNDADLTRAMQMTGGYIDYLRANAVDLLSGVDNSDEALRYCVSLGKFVAYMRARPSVIQNEEESREFAARLVSQLLRLANCLAIVLNRKSLDEEVLRRTRQVALDTARGQTMNLAKLLFNPPSGGPGAEVKALALWAKSDDHTVRRLLKFLHKIGAAEPFNPSNAVAGIKSPQRWRLTERVHRLYDTVMRTDHGY